MYHKVQVSNLMQYPLRYSVESIGHSTHDVLISAAVATELGLLNAEILLLMSVSTLILRSY